MFVTWMDRMTVLVSHQLYVTGANNLRKMAEIADGKSKKTNLFKCLTVKMWG